MINAEKYKNKILKFVEEKHDSLFGLDKNSEPISCTVSRCNNCQFGFKKNNYIEGYSCSAAKIKWLLAEYKEPIKVSKFEYDILKYISDNTVYLYIARDKSGFLGVYRSEPDRLNTSWCCCNSTGHLDVFTKLFQFVKWQDEEPRAIKDILENCEVVDDAKE